MHLGPLGARSGGGVFKRQRAIDRTRSRLGIDIARGNRGARKPDRFLGAEE